MAIQNKCVKCGSELEAILDLSKTADERIGGYQCNNPDCELNNEKKAENNWSLEQHKDNQSWAVRHIRSLEDQLKKQQQQIDTLVKKLEGI